MSDIHVFYRVAMQPAAQSKNKLPSATKIACLRNCIATFGLSALRVFGDRLDNGMTCELRGLGVDLFAVDEGSGGGTFRQAANAAMQLGENERIYLVEDDFLHLPAARSGILDGLSMRAEYVTLYDHPDKYIDHRNGGNPLVRYGGEKTRLLCGSVCHWKITNSTVMTFATTAGQLRKDWKTFLKYCGGRYTDDYRLFRALAWRGRRLISSVPGLATHCESKFLSPLTDWSLVAGRVAEVPEEVKIT